MKNRTRKIQITLLFTLVLILTGSVTGQTLMERLPGDTLLCVRVNGFDQTLGKVDQFLMGASPIPLSVASMARMQLGNMLGNSQLQGLDTQGVLTLVAVAGEQGPNLGLLVPMTDFQAFTDGSPKIKAQGDGYVMAGPQGQSFQLTELGDYALFLPGGNPAQLGALKKQLMGGGSSLASKLDSKLKQAAAEQPIWVYIDTAMVGKMLAPFVQMAVSQAQAMMSMMGAKPGQSADASAVAGTVGTQLCNRLAQESRYATLSLAPSRESLALEVDFQAKPGSTMAKTLTRTGAKRDSTLLGFLQEGAVLNISGNMMRKLMNLGLNALSKTPASQQENLAEIKTLVTKVADQFGGSGALSLKLTPAKAPYVSLQYVSQVKDGTRLREQVGQLTELLQAKLPETAARFKLERNQQSHRGTKVDAVKVALPEGQGPVRSVDYYMAFVDKLMVLSLGSDGEAGIQSLIDKTKDAGRRRKPKDVTQLLDAAPGTAQADMIATLNVARLIQQTPRSPADMGSGVVTPSKSGLVAQLGINNGRADFGLTLPKTHLQEITQVLQMMMMQRMMQQQQQQQPANR